MNREGEIIFKMEISAIDMGEFFEFESSCDYMNNLDFLIASYVVLSETQKTIEEKFNKFTNKNIKDFVNKLPQFITKHTTTPEEN